MKIIVKFLLSIFDKFTENKINKFLKKIFLNEISVLIDVGSHKGEYILNILNNFKVNKIYAFEPTPNIFFILKKKLSKHKNINFYNYGVGENSGREILNFNMESSSTSINKLNINSKYYKKKYFFLNPLKNKEVTKPIEINIVNLKNFFIDNKIQKVNLLKIDTEGYEYKVLKGLGNEINKIDYIHLEHHFDDMIIKNYKLSDMHSYLLLNNFEKIFKVKMKFRKSFEYIYKNNKVIK